MDEKDYEVLSDDELFEKTKEINTLKDLSLEALNNLEDTFDTEEDTLELQSEFDESLEDADLVFKTQVETKQDLEQKEKKKESFGQKIMNKWRDLEKQKKIMIISIILILIILLVVAIALLFKKDDPVIDKVPDVILKSDNYRYENGKLIFLDDEEEIGTYECTNKDEKLCAVAYLTNDSDLDVTSKVSDDGTPLILHSDIYYKRFVFLIDHKNESDKDIKLYDIKEGKVLKTVFAIKAYGSDYVALKNDSSKYGLDKITENEVTTVIPYEYDNVSVISRDGVEKSVAVRKDNNSYLASFENKILTKAFNSTITSANDKYVVTKDANGNYHVYDYNAKEVNSATQQYVVLMDEYMISVRSNKLYVLTYDGAYMNGAPIELKNDKYNVIETYKDKKLVKVMKSFDYELSDAVLNVNVYDENGTDKENYALNLYEGKLSSKLAYMNYFDGTLEFFADETKKTSLGTYSCNNRNSIDKDTTSLSNCRLASESFYRQIVGNTKEVDESSKLGWIPIFGKKYAFIQDGNNILLYNLSEKKEIARYSSVDTSSYTHANEVVLSDASTIPFIAVSKNSGKYGVAKISSEGVNPVISFEYDNIKRLGDYYVVKSGNTYALYDLNGQKKSVDLPSEIVDYHGNHIKTMKDDTYFVHSFDKEGSGSGYTYVELYDSFYGAIKQNHVHLYDYEAKDLFEHISDKTESQLEIKVNNYYGSGTKSFTVANKLSEIDGEKYYVLQIGTVTGYVTVTVPVAGEEAGPGDTDE